MIANINIGKRLFDVVCSLCGLIVLAPFLAIISVLIKIDSRGTIFFFTERVGKNGKIFNLIKFRSMHSDPLEEKHGFIPGDKARITKVGRFLRRTKIDELPELFNVLKGEISMVGPRPEVSRYVRKWSKTDRKIILSVKPGVTDYASLCFSDEEKLLIKAADPEIIYLRDVMPHKLRLYRKYIKERSLWLDLRIILETIAIIAMLNVNGLLPELKDELQGRSNFPTN